jgi:hypothetical protein
MENWPRVGRVSRGLADGGGRDDAGISVLDQ